MVADTADGADGVDGVVSSVLPHGRYPDGPHSQPPLAAAVDRAGAARAHRGASAAWPAGWASPLPAARRRCRCRNRSSPSSRLPDTSPARWHFRTRRTHGSPQREERYITVAVGSDGITMVDGQFAPLHDKIRAAIAAISPLPIKYLINTHFHGDHTGGNEAFQKDRAIVVAQDNIRAVWPRALPTASPGPRRRRRRQAHCRSKLISAVR
jgi:Metallo-beta-lactamase superfamily